MVARQMKNVQVPEGKELKSHNRINGRIERGKTFPKALPGTEMVRRSTNGSRIRYFHRKLP